MDIARIRKKLKDAKKKKSSRTKSADSEDVKKRENVKPSDVYEVGLAAPEDSLPRAKETGVRESDVYAENETFPEKTPDHESVEGEKEAEELVEFLKFKVGGDAYAFRLTDIEEILRPKRITIVPRSNPYVLGVTSFRGKIIPVVDIGRKFEAGKENGKGFDSAKIVILRGPKDSIGVPVLGGMDVVLLPESNIMEPPAHIPEHERRLIEGVAMINNGFMTIVRVEEVLDFNLTGEA